MVKNEFIPHTVVLRTIFVPAVNMFNSVFFKKQIYNPFKTRIYFSKISDGIKQSYFTAFIFFFFFLFTRAELPCSCKSGMDVC